MMGLKRSHTSYYLISLDTIFLNQRLSLFKGNSWEAPVWIMSQVKSNEMNQDSWLPMNQILDIDLSINFYSFCNAFAVI